jgi:LPXTG-motif cell wall-anchored protein
MIRRMVFIAAAAAALAIVPTAAFGYGGTSYTDKGTVSDSTPAPGQSFTVTVHGPAGTSVTLTITSNPASIAGTTTLVKTTNASGDATFTVTLAKAGTYTLVTTDTASGAVLSTQVVTVAAAGSAAASGGSLATTGAEPLPILLGAGGLLVLGAGGVVIAKRRKTV